MKKLLLFAIAGFALACSNNDDEERPQECDNKLWELVQLGSCGPIENDCAYFATYGENEATAGTVEVNQATFNYYSNLGNTNDGSLCWEGTKD